MANKLTAEERHQHKLDNHNRWRARNPDYNNNYYLQDRETQLARSKQNRAKLSPDVLKYRMREMTLRRHGTTDTEYQTRLVAQGGHCVFCDTTPDQCRHGVLCIDHDPTKKKGEPGYIRGLLCMKHNTSLGVFGDNEAGLLKAVAYLRGELTCQ